MAMNDKFVLPDAVEIDRENAAVVVLDQTLLPCEEKYESLTGIEEFVDAIKKLKVRGAPAIGVAAAAGLAACTKRKVLEGTDRTGLSGWFDYCSESLKASRPTAVNLAWAVDRMKNLFDRLLADGNEPVRIAEMLFDEAENIKNEDICMCRAIAANGLPLISKKGCGILTHCNAGHLAVSRFGTAISPIYLAHESGLEPKVYADETRPLLQGARLTAYELSKAGVDVTLICDNMAASLMASGKIDVVMVGCDRIALNGDVANKIGTLQVAILADYFGIPFYVLGPSSTFDAGTASGKDIKIEQRPAEEITTMHYSKRLAPDGIKVFNPAFDVTPASLITGYVTEKGYFASADGLVESVRKGR